jgi:hypothetical protein
VTEAEWQACHEPSRMIQYLEVQQKSTPRKLRLFGVACFRRLEEFHTNHDIRRMVETAEAYSDRHVGYHVLRSAKRKAERLSQQLQITADSPRGECILAHLAVAATWLTASDTSFRTDPQFNRLIPGGYHAAAAGYISSATQSAAFYTRYEGADALAQVLQRDAGYAAASAEFIWQTEDEAQSQLLHDIIGNPFCSAAVDPRWHTSSVLGLARAMYDSRDFVAMPILADALEEAGCDNADVLTHCRGSGPHVRGCWVVDLILGKR